MKWFVLLLLYTCLIKQGQSKNDQNFPFRNISLDWSVRVDDLVSRLTPHEIIDQMAYGGGWNEGVTPPITRLNIKPYSWGTECLRGDVSENSTGFPQAINLASTWNKQLVKAVANATAYEVHAHYNRYQQEGLYGVHRGLSCFSPVINIMRHPLWGRNQETYGECPYLSGMFAIHFVRGLQGPSSARYLNTNAGYGPRCLQYNQTDTINYLKDNYFDLIILSLGTGQDIESEGNDRATMNLPNNQSQLLEDILKTLEGRKTKILLFIISGTPLDIQLAQESNQIQAIVHLGFGAQELGEALRLVIIGDGISKFGRLPYTWPKKLSDLPGDITQYDMTSGFTYRYSNVEPLYRFGYGLSYSSFFYYDLSFNATNIKPGDGLKIYFTIKNTGDRISDEIVQVYLSIHLKNTSLANVSRAQLVDFERLSDINPSEIILYQTIISREQMAVYIDGKGFLIVPATLEFKIGDFIQPYLSGNVTIDGEFYYVGQYISYASA
ncbi:unnamed protein product [Rotaria magnacalcarata]|uniref:Fibronectin type III-like domain-containing protein n=1 Tax=Rotaria magnacalcarata TaxID=392030 RepID=A0A8S2K6C9_9BILA|nr:unnamed protein product [Rotaria magnacalcarata]